MTRDASNPSSASVSLWLVESRLSAKVEANVERMARSDDVRRIAVMPDVHLGKLVNNGSVAATTHLIYPQAVGADIGCGFSLLGFDTTTDCLREERYAMAVIGDFYRIVPAFKHGGQRTLPEKLTAQPLSDVRLEKDSRREGAYQLGTLGCGNHFVELQRDDTERLWVMVHSGSRAMGQFITEFHLSRAAVSATGLKYLDTQGESGRAYFNDMEWALQYSTLNRLAILARITEALKARFHFTADEDTYLDSPHNFARWEHHGGERLIVHRKSANSARAEELGIVAGSMGSPSFITRGLGREDALCSSAHGAGRVLSRTEAEQRVNANAMARQLAGVHYDRRYLASLRDEAPAVYRDIRKVMHAQRDLVRQEARLSPLLSFKYPDSRGGGRV